jgi:hypothetical protein
MHRAVQFLYLKATAHFLLVKHLHIGGWSWNISYAYPEHL